ncbi:Metallo-dependent hydrolase, partial [Serendipita vermifera]
LCSSNQPYPPFLPPPSTPYPSTICIRNAHVIDGLEKPDNRRYLADVTMKGGIITSISRHQREANNFLSDLTAEEMAQLNAVNTVLEIAATGLVLCPGFIDMHAHSDLHLLTHPSHIPKLSQGITTEVIGQDGIGYAPLIFSDIDGDKKNEQTHRYKDDSNEALEYVRHQIAGWNGNPDAPPAHYPASEQTKPFFSWRTVESYLDTLDHHIPPTNVAYLVPQGNLRLLTVGSNPGKASEQDIRRMQRLLRQCLDEGAVGMSSGLTYVPGMYADTEELEALCEVLVEASSSSLDPPCLSERQDLEGNPRQYKPYYCPHTRSYGLNVLDAYEEMLQLGLKPRAPIHLTHATLNFPPNAGIAPRFLELLGKYEDMGVDVTLDSYPYLPGSTTLSAMLPSWALAGGKEKTMKRLRGEGDEETVSFSHGDKVLGGLATLTEIREDVCVRGSDGCHGFTIDWDTIEIAGLGTREANLDPILSKFVGRRLGEIAHEFSSQDSAIGIGSRQLQTPSYTLSSISLSDPFNLFVHILLRDSLATIILQHVGHEDNVRRVMSHHGHMMSTDALLAPTKPHPRAWGTTGRYLGFYGRDIFSVKQDTNGRVETSHTEGLTLKGPDGLDEKPISERFPSPFRENDTLEDSPSNRRPMVPRGLIRVGFAADLVVFDPIKVKDWATFAQPNQQSVGIEWVFVNGKVAVEKGRVTGVRGGRTIRRDKRTGLVW